MRAVLAGSYAALRCRRRAVGRLLAWSVPEALPAALSGLVIARAVDSGFAAGRPMVGFALLGMLALAAPVGALGVRQVNRAVADVVEPLRDDLVRRVVTAALRAATVPRPAATGDPTTGPARAPTGPVARRGPARAPTGPVARRGPAADSGAVARLTRQVEAVRDAFAGLVLVARGFLVTTVAALAGLGALAPELLPLILPPMLVGLAVFARSLASAAAWQRAAILADERLGDAAGTVLAAARDVTACRAEERAAAMLDDAVSAQLGAERAMARMAAVRAVSVGLAGWLPLVVVLTGTGWLISRGVSAGTLVGALAYLSQAMLPALETFVRTVGAGGLRYAVTLDRIQTATSVEHPGPPARPLTLRARSTPAAGDLVLRDVGFRYGPASATVVDRLSLTVPAGDHLVLVGPSGAGKSTLAALMCGVLAPQHGSVRLDGYPVTALTPAELSHARVLIPQEAYVFAGTVGENLTYLAPDAGPAEVGTAIEALGAGGLVAEVGGLRAAVTADRLSAGQRQLISLVRSYLAPARFVLLDEATCHLDPAAEARVERAFAARGGTLVVVAHRISSAERARRVLLLDGGRVALGDHTDLLRQAPGYRALTGAWQVGPGPAAGPVTASRPPPPGGPPRSGSVPRSCR